MARRRKLKAGRFAALAGVFWRDPERHRLSARAQALYCAALSYAADQRTEGKVPGFMVAALVGGDPGDAPEELVALGWWERDGDGFVAGAWANYNLTNAELDERAAQQRARVGKRWGHTADDAVGDTAGNADGNTIENEEREETATDAVDHGSQPDTGGTPDGYTPPDPRPQTPDPIPQGNTIRARPRTRWLALWAVRFETATNSAFPGLGRHIRDGVDSWIERQAEREQRDPEAVAEELVAGFFADPWAQECTYPIGALVNNPARFYRAQKPKRGPAPAAAPEAFRDDDPAEVWGEAAHG